MPAPDFIAILGRLLRSGVLRDEFASDPLKFAIESGLSEDDCRTLVQMSAEDLEAQARVLLRKRFDAVRRVLTQTCQQLGTDAWPKFVSYARSRAAADENRVVADALAFSEHLRFDHVAVCPAEHNRLRFVQRNLRAALHLIVVTPPNRARRLALQFVWRWRKSRRHEWHFYFAA